MGHRPGWLPHRARPVARRASRRHDSVRPSGSGAQPMTGSHPRSARDVVEELFRRQRAGDDTVLDDLVAEGDLAVQHVTLHGTHRASTMPLLADAPVTGRSAAWTFIHIWRVADGMLVEHWACRDDMGLLEQLRPS